MPPPSSTGNDNNASTAVVNQAQHVKGMRHQLTYRRTNHANIHVRGYKEEGTITTAFDMTVLNDIDRFHLVMDTIDRLPQTGEPGLHLKRRLEAKLVEHKLYIRRYGEDMPEIRNWVWGGPA